MFVDDDLSCRDLGALAKSYDVLYTRLPLDDDGLSLDGSFLVDWLCRALQPRSRVLDLGCGQGRTALALAAESHRVTAIDISTVGLEQLREERSYLRKRSSTYGGLSVRHGDIRRFQPQQPYSAIIACQVFHHLSPEEVDAILTMVTRSVRPGGYFGVAVHLGHPALDFHDEYYPSSAQAFIDRVSAFGWRLIDGYSHYHSRGEDYGAVFQLPSSE